MNTDIPIRIIIPAFNADDTIAKCVTAIVDATTFLTTREIIVVDNRGSDRLEDILCAFPVKIIKRTAFPSAAYARNEGAAACSQGILVFIDSDVICEKDCISRLIAPICEHRYNATIGNYSKNTTGLSFAQKYKQLYISHVYQNNTTSIRNDFWTAIAAIDAAVFHELGGFNENFKGANGEDQEFGIRLTRAGYRVFAIPNANGQHINPYTVRKIIKNDFRKGITAVQNSVNNKVPLSDNRHAGRTAMLAVASAVLATCLFVSALFVPACLYGSAFALVAWSLCRSKLMNEFLRIMGFSFLLQAALLMYLLDLTRCTAVIMAVAKRNITKPQPQKNEPIKVTT